MKVKISIRLSAAIRVLAFSAQCALGIQTFADAKTPGADLSGVIAYSCLTGKEDSPHIPKVFDLYIERLPGHKPIQLTDARHSKLLGHDIGDVSIDATGKYVAFTCHGSSSHQASGGLSLWIVNLPTRSLTLVTKDIASYEWSPRGSRLLTLSSSTLNNKYSIYDATVNTKRVLMSATDVADLHWINNGRSVIYGIANKLVKEMELKSGKVMTRWKSPDDQGFEIYASPVNQSAIIYTGTKCYSLVSSRSGVSGRSGRLNSSFDVGNFDPPGLIWSSDGRHFAIHDYTHYPPREPGTDTLPTCTDQFIDICDSRNVKAGRTALSWTDSVTGPYRYRLVKWVNRRGSLLIFDRGANEGGSSNQGQLICYNPVTRSRDSLIQFGSMISSIDWHEGP